MGISCPAHSFLTVKSCICRPCIEVFCVYLLLGPAMTLAMGILYWCRLKEQNQWCNLFIHHSWFWNWAQFHPHSKCVSDFDSGLSGSIPLPHLYIGASRVCICTYCVQFYSKFLSSQVFSSCLILILDYLALFLSPSYIQVPAGCAFVHLSVLYAILR